MLGNFYPFVVTAGSNTPAFSPVNVRSTSAATEIANDVEWLVTYS